MTSRLSRLPRLLALLFAFSIVAAACGSSDDGGADEPAATTAPDDAGDTTDTVVTTDDGADSGDTSTGEAAGDGDDDMPEGPTVIDRTGEVVRVGYVNTEGGAISLPELRVGGEVAIGVINASGGIHGAMIETVVCLTDGTPEGAINCAVKLIEEDIVLAYMGVELASEAAIHHWLDAGIAYVSSNSWGPTERNSPGAFLLHAASGAYAVGPAKTFKDLGIDHIGVITQDSPTGLDFLDNIIGPVLEHNGIEMERIVVDSAAPDWTAAIAAAQTSGVEGLMGQLDEFGCIGMVGSAAASGFDKPIFAGSCTVYINLLGEAALGTYTQGDQWIPSIQQFAPPEIAERLEAFREDMTAAGYANMIDGFAVAPYSAWRELEFILETIEGPITPESVIAAFGNAGETPGWFGPNLRCGQAPWPAESSHCTSEIMVWQIQERDDGTMGRVPIGGGFFDAYEYSGL